MKELVRRFEVRLAAVRLPSRPVSAALVLLCLAFGALIGRVTRIRADGRRPRIELREPSTVAQTNRLPPSSEAASTPASEEEAEEQHQPGGKGPTKSNGKTGTKPAAKSQTASQQQTEKASTKLPAIKHVFLVMLDEVPYAESFGPEGKSRYLSHTLEAKGELLERYYAVAHQQLPDGIALISGQGPTEQTASDCPTYAEISPAGKAAEEQVTGSGCVYPAAVKTIASQLSGTHLTWKAYVQAIGNGGSEASSACYHPQLGAADPTAALGQPTTALTGGVASATFSDPFVYFRSITDSSACATDVVGLDDLAGDLHSASRTPNLSYIAPDLCDDGISRPCAAGKPDGMTAAEAFLRQVVPEILASKAYQQNGLLLITVDQAPSSGEYADSSSCCDQPQFPNLHGSAASAGGGEVGALLLSPFIKGGKISQQTYNDFSMLRTIEDIFGLEHLGYAALSGVQSLSPSLFSGG